MNRISTHPPPYLVLKTQYDILKLKSEGNILFKICFSKPNPNPNTDGKKIESISTWVDEIKLQLLRRGFYVESSVHDPDGTHAFLLSITSKRYQILDANRYAKGFQNLTFAERFRLAQDSMEILERLTSMNFGLHFSSNMFLSKNSHILFCKWKFWIAHDKEELSRNRMDRYIRKSRKFCNPIFDIFSLTHIVIT